MTKALNKKEKYLFFAIMLFAVAVRIIFFCLYLSNGGIHCDEAMLLLNARSINNNSADILGKSFPIFFDTWLYGGQSPFGTYLVALFIHIFGYSLAISRIPIFITSIIGLWALFMFCLKVFKNHKIAFCALLIGTVSPWHIFQSVWTIDCAFFPHLFLIALMFFAYAINSKKPKKQYFFSMIFFGLCFYSYLPSVFVVPIFLLVSYILLIREKKIKISDIAISVLTIFVVSLPFILFGLVSVGIIEPFSIGKITFSLSRNYSRNSDIIFAFIKSPKLFLSKLFENIGSVFIFLLLPILSCSSYEFTKFPYLGISATILLILLIVKLITSLKAKKKPQLKLNNKILIYSLLASFVVYICCVCNIQLISIYRYSWTYYFIFALLAFIVTKLIKSNFLFKKLLPVFLVLSISATAFLYVNYTNKFNILSSVDNSLEECLDFIEENNEEKVGFINHYTKSVCNEQQATFLRLYLYEQKENLVSLDNDLKSRGMSQFGSNISSEINLKKDGSWKYINPGSANSDYDAFVVFISDTNKVNYDKKIYKEKNFGSYCVIYKQVADK